MRGPFSETQNLQKAVFSPILTQQIQQSEADYNQ